MLRYQVSILRERERENNPTRHNTTQQDTTQHNTTRHDTIRLANNTKLGT